MTVRSGWRTSFKLPRPMIRGEVDVVLRLLAKEHGGELTAVRRQHTTDAYFIYEHPDYNDYIEVQCPGGIDGSPYLSDTREDTSLMLCYGVLTRELADAFAERLGKLFSKA